MEVEEEGMEAVVAMGGVGEWAGGLEGAAVAVAVWACTVVEAWTATLATGEKWGSHRAAPDSRDEFVSASKKFGSAAGILAHVV